MVFLGKVKNPKTGRFEKVISDSDCGLVKALCAKRATEMYGKDVDLKGELFPWIRNSSNIPFFDEKCEFGDIICVEPVDVIR